MQWLKLSEFLTYNRKQMNSFKDKIDQAQIVGEYECEKERKRNLQAFLKSKNKRKAVDYLDGEDRKDAESLRLEYQ